MDNSALIPLSFFVGATFATILVAIFPFPRRNPLEDEVAHLREQSGARYKDRLQAQEAMHAAQDEARRFKEERELLQEKLDQSQLREGVKDAVIGRIYEMVKTMPRPLPGSPPQDERSVGSAPAARKEE